jgi:hypothetical protein
MKVAVDDGFNTNILFYGLGIVFVVLAIFLSNKLKRTKRDI